MSVKNKNRIIAVAIGIVVIIALIFIKKFAEGKIDSVESLQRYVLTFGIFAPLVLVTLQALQVVVPVLPGFLGCAVGAIMFGPMGGFWCNYIWNLCRLYNRLFLARKYGMDVVLLMFPRKDMINGVREIKKRQVI